MHQNFKNYSKLFKLSDVLSCCCCQEVEEVVIYNVGREEYHSCSVMSGQPRIVAYCTQPHQKKIFTLSFRSFSPMPNTLEFQPGQDYFFISTSSPEDVMSLSGG